MPGRYGALFEANDFAKAVFETASSSTSCTENELIIEGQDIAELALAFVAAIKTAAADNNFAPILTTERTFKM